MFVYRVHREDTHHGYWHQPLKRTVSEQSFRALLVSAKRDRRYKIIKVERAEVGDWIDVTREVLDEVIDEKSQ